MGAQLQAGGGGRGKGRRRRNAAPMSEINVTPFVDVMLVLLIIFMVAAPLLTVGVPLNLPESEANPLPVASEVPLTINLASDGQIFLQKTPIAYEELALRLPSIAAEREDGRVFLRADAALDYGSVALIMGLLNKTGFNSIALVTDGVAPAPVDEQ